MSGKIADILNETAVKGEIIEMLKNSFRESFPNGIHQDDYITLIIEGKAEKELEKRLKLVLHGSETQVALNLLISFLIREYGLNPKGKIGVIFRKAKQKEIAFREDMEGLIELDD